MKSTGGDIIDSLVDLAFPKVELDLTAISQLLESKKGQSLDYYIIEQCGSITQFLSSRKKLIRPAITQF